ncbi:MAG: ATP synthase complex assembly protein atp12 [Vezdaea acicularis]|nr:MAG: ATP synthase complex assembly protein atp12 [Vezdaea acicularis]
MSSSSAAAHLLRLAISRSPFRRKSTFQTSQCLHTTSARRATPLPTTSSGPPPSAPVPPASSYEERIARRRRQAELQNPAQALKTTQKKPGATLRKRFWKEVHVREVKDGYQIHLDTRALQTPSKHPLLIPRSKPHLALALALEWELLPTAAHATRQHLIPLTSLTARAQDLQLQDAQSPQNPTREDIVNTLMRYLDTDTMLCWAPESPSTIKAAPSLEGDRVETLRDLQIRTAMPITSFLARHVWPGVEIVPVTDSESIVPKPQPEMTRSVIRGWLTGLPAYELVGLERAVLACKGLLGAVRLLVEWSESVGVAAAAGEGQREVFDIERAAQAASLEVDWQTGMWGEVEDSHDVEKEDLRRQLGSVVLLVSGERKAR